MPFSSSGSWRAPTEIQAPSETLSTPLMLSLATTMPLSSLVVATLMRRPRGRARP